MTSSLWFYPPMSMIIRTYFLWALYAFNFDIFVSSAHETILWDCQSLMLYRKELQLTLAPQESEHLAPSLLCKGTFPNHTTPLFKHNKPFQAKNWLKRKMVRILFKKSGWENETKEIHSFLERADGSGAQNFIRLKKILISSTETFLPREQL